MRVLCPQCGAPAAALTESSFHRCAYCSSSFLVREGKGITEYTFRHEWDDRQAWSSLTSHLEARGVTDPAGRDRTERIFFPFWLHSENGDRRSLIPALPPPLSEIAAVTLPAGDMVFVEENAEYPEPSVTLAEAMEQFGAEEGAGKWSLVHIPLYLLEYSVRERSFTAVVSGADGKLFTFSTPSPSETSISVTHIGMTASFAILLVLEGALIRNHLIRGVAFLVSFALLYPLFLFILKKEIRL